MDKVVFRFVATENSQFVFGGVHGKGDCRKIFGHPSRS